MESGLSRQSNSCSPNGLLTILAGSIPLPPDRQENYKFQKHKSIA